MNIAKYLLLIVIIGAFIPVYAHESPEHEIHTGRELISDFNTDIVIHEDATISVTETIHYDFGEGLRHGIIREITLTNAVGTFDTLKITDVQVTDEQGVPVSFTASGQYRESTIWSSLFKGSILSEPDSMVVIKIGSSEEHVSGKKIYKISYNAKDAIGYFDDRVEIYWNTTGHHWLVPIERVTATVTIPENEPTEVMVNSFCGQVFSVSKCTDDITMSLDEQAEEVQLFFNRKELLVSGDGMTVAVAFSKDEVALPSTKERPFWESVLVYWPVLIGGFLIFRLFRKRIPAWIKVRKYEQNHTIIPQYDANSIEPAEVDALFDEQNILGTGALSAQIIYLAIQGHLIIKKESNGYSFKATEADRSTLSDYNVKLLESLEGKDTASLKDVFYQSLHEIEASFEGHLKDVHYYYQKGEKEFVTTIPVFVFLLVICVAIAPVSFIGLFFGKVLGIVLGGVCVLYAVMPFLPFGKINMTEKGLEKRWYLEGLRLYIAVAEQQRIRFHNAPEKNPELFERLLPYAMVFGLERKWAAEFSGIYQRTPSWYEGSVTNSFSATSFASDMRSFSRDTASITSKPGSSYGSSGSSSGSSSGHSGGGGGGGGGRSW